MRRQGPVTGDATQGVKASMGGERAAVQARAAGPRLLADVQAGSVARAARGVNGSRWRQVVVLLACLMPFASFVLASRGVWLLDFQWEDNWSYLKYFYDWTSSDPVLRDFMDHDYKGARVAWIALGYVAYHALSPLAANLVLNGAVAVLTVLLVFGLTTRLFGQVAGAATIIASAFQVFYSSGYPHAWSYQGSICNVFYLLLLWCLTEHARGGARARWALLAGVAATLTLLTGTSYVIAVPWALAYWALLRGKPGLLEVMTAGVMAAVGAVVTIAGLAAASVVAGGPLLFVLPLLVRSMRIASDVSFGQSLQDWLPNASWLAFPFIVLLGTGVTTLVLLRRGTLCSRQSRPAVAATVAFAGLWLTMIVMEATVQAYVQYAHYNFMITGPAALALGGVLRWLPRETRQGRVCWPVVVYPLLAVLVIAPQLLLDPPLVTTMATAVTQLLQTWSLPGMVVLSALAACIGLGLIASGGWRTLLPAGVCFGVACALSNPTAAPFHLTAACSIERDDYLLVTDVTRWMASQGWHVSSRAWYSTHDSVARPDGCGDVNLVWTFAEIEQAGMLWKVAAPLPAQIADLSPLEIRNIAEKPRAHLVILSAPTMAQQYDGELVAWARTNGLSWLLRPATRRTFTRGALSMTVQVYPLRQPPRGSAPSAIEGPAARAVGRCADCAG